VVAVLSALDPNSEVWDRDRNFDAYDERVAAATGQRNAADAAVVALVAECLEAGWWQAQGTSSPEHWCRARLGVGVATSYRLVRVARGLSLYPEVRRAFEAGRLSLDFVDVVAQMRPNRRYDRDIAESGPVWDLPRARKIMRNFGLPPEPDPDAATDDDDDEERAERRRPEDVVNLGFGDDGRYRGNIDVNPALGHLVDKAFAAARKALFSDRTGVDADDDDREGEPSSVSPVDALERLAHAALDGLDPEVAKGRRPGDRYQVLIHIDSEDPDDAHWHLGSVLPAALRREVCCDADLREAIVRDGRIVALGRRRRTVDSPLRWAIEDRDGGCRVPGCGRRRFVHVHHIVFWEDGGPTDPSNLVALCPEHHRAVHAGTLTLRGDPDVPDGPGSLEFLHDGTPLPTPRAAAPPGPPPPSTPYQGTHWAERIRWN
jgi:hypothetical protein